MDAAQAVGLRAHCLLAPGGGTPRQTSIPRTRSRKRGDSFHEACPHSSPQNPAHLCTWPPPGPVAAGQAWPWVGYHRAHIRESGGLLFCTPVRVEPGPQSSVNLYLDQAADCRPRCLRVCFLPVTFVPAAHLPPHGRPRCPGGSAAGRLSLRPAQPRWCCMRASVPSHPCVFSPSDFLVTIWRLPPRRVAGSQNFTKSPFLSFGSTVVVQRTPALLLGIIKIYFASCRRQAEQNRTGVGVRMARDRLSRAAGPTSLGASSSGGQGLLLPPCSTFGALLGGNVLALGGVRVRARV